MISIEHVLSASDPTPRVIATMCEATVNSLTYRPELVAQSIYGHPDAIVKDRFLQISAAFTKNLAFFSKTRRYDDRNEIACKVAAAIMECRELDPLMEATTWKPDGKSLIPELWERRNQKTLDLGGKCAMHMYNMHRTLQQQFASLCFCYISKYMTAEQRSRVEELSGVYGWCKCLPMV